jgi:AcrR family transcriptional regulator
VASPGTARPGGRTARIAESVYAAAIAELGERGYADISVESIAARAGVHKTTVYRRWGSNPELIRQALAGAAGIHIQIPDTGSVDADVRALAHAVQAILSSPEGAAITTALIVGGLSSPEIAGLMEQFWAGRLEAIKVIVARATRRGQLPEGTDPAAFMHATSAPLYFRLLVTREPITERDADVSAAAALAAARDGVFLASSGHPSGRPGAGTGPD